MKKLLLALLLTTASAFAADTTPYKDATALWQGFDPRKDPLDVKVINERTEDGLVLRTVQYSSETVDGFTIRVLAYYGFPVGAKKLPAIIHVHGGGQNAMMDYVKFWGKKGYAAMSINWGGKFLESKEENGKTDYGPVPVNQNDKDSHSVFAATGHDNSWYRWAAVIRRGITFMEQQPEVDPDHIGMFGISMGGRLMWLVAGTETRLKCITSIYGGAMMDQELPGLPHSEFIPGARQNPTWQATLDAAAYAPLIKIPFLFLSSANDFWSRMDFIDRTMALIPGPAWRCFSLHVSHQINNPQIPTLGIWMDHWLRNGAALPSSPAISLGLNGVLSGTVTPASPADVKSVDIMYSTGVYPEPRFWRTTRAVNSNGRWTSTLPLTVLDKNVHVFANVFYASGLCLSTKLAVATPEQLAQARIPATDKPTLVIEDFKQGYVDWMTPATTNVPLGTAQEFDKVVGPNGSLAITPTSAGADWLLTTRKIDDPKYTAPAGATLAVTMKSDKPDSVVVVLTQNEGRPPAKPRKYAASLTLKGGNWETLDFPLSSFKAVDDNTPLTSWDQINVLSLCGRYRIANKKTHTDTYIGDVWQGGAPTVTRLEWVK